MTGQSVNYSAKEAKVYYNVSSASFRGLRVNPAMSGNKKINRRIIKVQIGTIITIAVIVLLLVLIIGWVVSTYNKLIKHKNMVKTQWSQIDIQLKRRFDMIPNLVETVKGYASHEKDTLEAVMAARNAAASANSPGAEVEANNQLTGALNKLFALSENYPDLKANSSFMSLQNDIKETEDKIAYSRQFYNDAVFMYQNMIEKVPSNIVAGIFGFKAKEFITIGDTERENVRVSF